MKTKTILDFIQDCLEEAFPGRLIKVESFDGPSFDPTGINYPGWKTIRAELDQQIHASISFFAPDSMRNVDDFRDQDVIRELIKRLSDEEKKNEKTRK